MLDRHAGITGLEQYSLERAGYFIRRRAADADALAGIAAEGSRQDAGARLVSLPEIDAIVHDLFRSPHVAAPAAAGTGGGQTEWHRDFEVDPSLLPAEQVAALHRHPPAYRLRLAVSPSDDLLVIPGSHVLPGWSGDGDESAGAVRIRLGAGDALIYARGLLRRTGGSDDSTGGVLEALIEPGPLP